MLRNVGVINVGVGNEWLRRDFSGLEYLFDSDIISDSNREVDQMSLEYCEDCDNMIDLDVDDEHFENHKDKEVENDRISNR